MLAFNLGGQEIALVGLAVLLLFGAKRLPEVFRSLGQGISEFKRASREVFREFEEERPSRPRQTQLPGGVSGAEGTGEGSASSDENKTTQ